MMKKTKENKKGKKWKEKWKENKSFRPKGRCKKDSWKGILHCKWCNLDRMLREWEEKSWSRKRQKKCKKQRRKREKEKRRLTSAHSVVDIGVTLKTSGQTLSRIIQHSPRNTTQTSIHRRIAAGRALNRASSASSAVVEALRCLAAGKASASVKHHPIRTGRALRSCSSETCWTGWIAA